MELGSVAELISSFGTLAALLAASVAAKAAIQTSRQQGKQLKYLEDAERRRQVEADQRDAANIAVWTGIDDEGRPAVRLVNNSGLPTYDLTVWMTVPGDLLQVDYQVHGPTDGRILRRASKKILQWANDKDGLDWARSLLIGNLAARRRFVTRQTAGGSGISRVCSAPDQTRRTRSIPLRSAIATLAKAHKNTVSPAGCPGVTTLLSELANI